MIGTERYCILCGASNTATAIRCFACGMSLKTTTPLQLDTDTPLLKERYRLQTIVGKGGFSTVYRAEDITRQQNFVAIKAVTLNGLRPQEIIEATDSFNREVALLSALQHPNLPHIYDHFSDTECWYMVMDFIAGVTLEKHLEQQGNGLLPQEEVFDIGLLLCDVLSYLHSRQPAVIFRDLKPANIILTEDGHLALIDFGIARRFKKGQAKDTIPFGSPGYAAPEQYGKKQTTPQADIYSLGVILHQLLTGNDPSQTPFNFTPLSLPNIPEQEKINALLMQMVEMDVEKRPQHVAEVKERLQTIAWEVRAQHMQGLSAQGWTHYTPHVVSWRTIPAFPAGDELATTSAGSQAQVMHPWLPGQSGSQRKTGTKQRFQRNRYALASVSLGTFGIIVPPMICANISNLSLPDIGLDHNIALIIVLILMATPSILAIIFGHTGKYQARKRRGPDMKASIDTAITGMTMGYIFGSIYLGAIVLILIQTLMFNRF